MKRQGKGGKGKMVQVVNQGAILSQLPQMRKRYKIGAKTEVHQNWWEYLTSRVYTYKDSFEDSKGTKFKTPVKVGEPYNIALSLVGEGSSKVINPSSPEFMRTLVNFLRISASVDMGEVSDINIAIQPPAKVPSSYVHEIPYAKMLTGHRFVVFIGSDEYIHYNMMDMTSVSQLVGFSAGSGNYAVPEAVERAHAYYFDQMTAVSLALSYNDERFYSFHVKNGKGTKTDTGEKRPLTRYILVIDFKLTFNQVREKFMGHITTLKDMAKKGGQQGEMAERGLTGLKERLKEETGIDIDESNTDAKKPSSITAPVGKLSASMFEEEDVEDVVIPNPEILATKLIENLNMNDFSFGEDQKGKVVIKSINFDSLELNSENNTISIITKGPDIKAEDETFIPTKCETVEQETLNYTSTGVRGNIENSASPEEEQDNQCPDLVSTEKDTNFDLSDVNTIVYIIINTIVHIINTFINININIDY